MHLEKMRAVQKPERGQRDTLKESYTRDWAIRGHVKRFGGRCTGIALCAREMA